MYIAVESTNCPFKLIIRQRLNDLNLTSILKTKDIKKSYYGLVISRIELYF